MQCINAMNVEAVMCCPTFLSPSLFFHSVQPLELQYVGQFSDEIKEDLFPSILRLHPIYAYVMEIS